MPFSIAVISKMNCFGFFEDLMRIISFMRHPPYNDLKFLLESLQKCKIPKSGNTLEISTSLKHISPLNTHQNEKMKNYFITMPKDNELLLHHVSYHYLLSKFSADKILTIFKSLLSENRIIFVADDLPSLSIFTNSIYSLLFPFYWQHIFIPILPNEYLGSSILFYFYFINYYI